MKAALWAIPSLVSLALAGVVEVSRAADSLCVFSESIEATCPIPVLPPCSLATVSGPCSVNHTDPSSYLVSATAPTYAIPVVFHIIQADNGNGWVHPDSIVREIRVMNQRYNAIPGTLGEYGFDTHIEFFLAGIDSIRHTSWFQREPFCPLDTLAAHSLAWDPARYLNVYTVDNVGILGWSAFPWPQYLAADSLFDGVRYDYITIGNHVDAQGNALAIVLGVHEPGHWLGLWHTDTCFAGNGTADCATSWRQPPACFSNGDDICDTAPEVDVPACITDSLVFCNTNPYNYPFAVRDNNYMVGSRGNPLCPRQGFTSEQAARMRCTLETYRPKAYLGIVENSIQESVTQFCSGDVALIRFEVSWDTNLATNGPDSLKIYPPWATCPGATWRVAVSTPGAATTHHTVTWEGNCDPGAAGAWRYTIKTTNAPGGILSTRSECRPVGAVSCPSCGGGCRPPCEFE